MNRDRIDPPTTDEYAPYYETYVARARDTGAVELLRRQAAAMRTACEGMKDEEGLHRYAPGKWSVKEVIGHLIDAERVFAYRMLRVGRGDATPLSRFDENAYVAAAEFDRRSVVELDAEFQAIRASTLRLAEGLPAAAWTNRGTASNATVSARALLYIIAGHTEHHLAILRDRYGIAVP